MKEIIVVASRPFFNRRDLRWPISKCQGRRNKIFLISLNCRSGHSRRLQRRARTIRALSFLLRYLLSWCYIPFLDGASHSTKLPINSEGLSLLQRTSDERFEFLTFSPTPHTFSFASLPYDLEILQESGLSRLQKGKFDLK
jgi:hypothetical protein